MGWRRRYRSSRRRAGRRRAVNARGHFPNEQAALKILYLTVRSLDPTGKGAKKWSNRWSSRHGAR